MRRALRRVGTAAAILGASLVLGEVALRLMRPADRAIPRPVAGSTGTAPPARSLHEVVERLRAAGAADPDVGSHQDLLDAVVAHGFDDDGAIRASNVPEIEGAVRTRVGAGFPWATVASYRSTRRDAALVSAVHRAYHLFRAWKVDDAVSGTVRPDGSVEARVDSNAPFVGPVRYTFEARPVRREGAWVTLQSMLGARERKGVLESRGIVIAFPVGAGVDVVEAACTVIDKEIPPSAFARRAIEAFSLRDIQRRLSSLKELTERLAGPDVAQLPFLPGDR